MFIVVLVWLCPSLPDTVRMFTPCWMSSVALVCLKDLSHPESLQEPFKAIYRGARRHGLSVLICEEARMLRPFARPSVAHAKDARGLFCFVRTQQVHNPLCYPDASF